MFHVKLPYGGDRLVDMPTVLPLHAHGDHCWPDLDQVKQEGRLIDLMGPDIGPVLELAALPKGTEGGRTTVTIRVDLPDGRVVLTEVTLRLLKMAVETFATVWGE